MKKRFMTLVALLALSPSLFAMDVAVEEEEKVEAEVALPVDDVAVLKTFRYTAKGFEAFLKESAKQLEALKVEDEELTAEDKAEQGRITFLAEKVSAILENLSTAQVAIRKVATTLKPEGWVEWGAKKVKGAVIPEVKATGNDTILDVMAQLVVLKQSIEGINKNLATIKTRDGVEKVADSLQTTEESLAAITADIDEVIGKLSLNLKLTVSDMFNDFSARVASYAQTLSSYLSTSNK